MDVHSILDAAITLVEKANAVGVAAETILKALHERLFPGPHAASGSSDGSVYGSLSPQAKEAVDDAVEACQVD